MHMMVIRDNAEARFITKSPVSVFVYLGSGVLYCLTHNTMMLLWCGVSRVTRTFTVCVCPHLLTGYNMKTVTSVCHEEELLCILRHGLPVLMAMVHFKAEIKSCAALCAGIAECVKRFEKVISVM